MTTAPSFFHNQNNTLFPKVFKPSCILTKLPFPVQPTSSEPKVLDNSFNGNNTTICPKSQNNLGLVRPM